MEYYQDLKEDRENNSVNKSNFKLNLSLGYMLESVLKAHHW